MGLMQGTAQPGRLALSAAPVSLLICPGSFCAHCLLHPKTAPNHTAHFCKRKFIFNSAQGGGILMGENYSQAFLLQEQRGCDKTAAGLPGPDSLSVPWVLLQLRSQERRAARAELCSMSKAQCQKLPPTFTHPVFCQVRQWLARIPLWSCSRVFRAPKTTFKSDVG